MPEPSVIIEQLRRAGCVFAADEAELLIAEAAGGRDLADMVEQRCSGVPLEYVLGWATFCGLRIRVAPGVFVPRRRSELLAARARQRCSAGEVVVDLCCGSGAIAAALAAWIPGLRIHAADLDPVALSCARENLAELGQVHQGDLWDSLPPALRGRVGVVVANAPYVPTAEVALLPAEAREHEHRMALDGGPDGLDLHRRILTDASDWLRPSGALLIEVSHGQAPSAAQAFAEVGLVPEVELNDDYAVAVITGVRPRERRIPTPRR